MEIHEDLAARRGDLLDGYEVVIDDMPFVGARYGNSQVVHLRSDAGYHHWMLCTEHPDGLDLNESDTWREAALCETEARTGLLRLPDPPTPDPRDALGEQRRFCRRCASTASVMIHQRSWRNDPPWWRCRACYVNHVRAALGATADQLEELLGDLAKVRATKLAGDTRREVRSILSNLARECVEPWWLADVTELRPRTLGSLVRGITADWCPVHDVLAAERAAA